jgi:hypothetical protein
MNHGPGKLLRIVGEADRAGGQRSTTPSCAPRTAGRGDRMARHRVRRCIHTAKILRPSEDLPIVVEIVDTEDKIRALLPAIDALLEEAGGGGLVTLEAAEVIRYTPGSRRSG